MFKPIEVFYEKKAKNGVTKKELHKKWLKLSEKKLKKFIKKAEKKYDASFEVPTSLFCVKMFMFRILDFKN